MGEKIRKNPPPPPKSNPQKGTREGLNESKVPSLKNPPPPPPKKKK